MRICTGRVHIYTTDCTSHTYWSFELQCFSFFVGVGTAVSVVITWFLKIYSNDKWLKCNNWNVLHTTQRCICLKYGKQEMQCKCRTWISKECKKYAPRGLLDFADRIFILIIYWIIYRNFSFWKSFQRFFVERRNLTANGIQQWNVKNIASIRLSFLAAIL